MVIVRGALAATPLPAREPPLRIDLPPSSLQQALASLANRTGLQILYDPDLIQGLTVGGLHGVMTPGEALKRLLAATHISFEFTAADAVALHGNPAPEIHSVPYLASPHTVTIIGNRDQEIGNDSSVSLTSVKIDESPLLVPVATSSLAQSFIRDQQATRLEDALEYVSGTEIAPNQRSSAGFEIRGFPTYQYYLDGVRVSPDLHGEGFRDLADVDHVDILKGPASLLFGRSEPGGIINVVTKQPVASPMLSIEQRFGSFGRADTLVDAGGPLTSAGSLLYRFNAAWESDGSFRDVPGSHRIFFAPVLTWRPSQGIETTAYLEYLNSHDPSDSGLPVVGNRIPDVPSGRSLDEGGEVHTTDLRTGIRGSYTFQSGWTLRHHLDARWLHTPQAPEIALASDGLSSNRCDTSHCPVERMLLAIPYARGYTGYASVELARDLPLWRTAHSLLIGAEYFQTASYSDLNMVSDASLTTDLFHPSGMAIPLILLQDPTKEMFRNAHEHWAAVYTQDQVSFGEHLYLLVGVRFDSASAGIAQTTSQPLLESEYFQSSSLNIQMVKHREGLVWHPVPALSFYTLHTENFGMAPGLYAGADGGNDLPPQSATELEAGMKLELPGGRFAATLAAFDLAKENVSSTILEPALEPSVEMVFTGTVRNRGVELDVHGELLSRLEYLASLAYIDSRIIFVETPQTNFVAGEWIGRTGNPFFGVPREGGSAWLSYRFSDRASQGLKLGAGIVARGAREGDNSNDYELPGFAKWSGLAAYEWRAGATQMSFRLTVDNLFNAHYYESLSGTRTVMPAYPRRWVGSFRVQF